MLLLFVTIVLFVVVVVVVDHHFLFIEFIRRLLPPLVVLPAVVCAVFQSNSAFNSDISAWNTGAVTTMQASKSSID
jgi:surface protein